MPPIRDEGDPRFGYSSYLRQYVAPGYSPPPYSNPSNRAVHEREHVPRASFSNEKWNSLMHVVHVWTVTCVALAVAPGSTALVASSPANVLSEILTPTSAVRMLSENFTWSAKRVANISETFACSAIRANALDANISETFARSAIRANALDANISETFACSAIRANALDANISETFACSAIRANALPVASVIAVISAAYLLQLCRSFGVVLKMSYSLRTGLERLLLPARMMGRHGPQGKGYTWAGAPVRVGNSYRMRQHAEFLTVLRNHSAITEAETSP